MSMQEHESEFTVEQQLSGDLASLAMAWQEIGLDPDDFVKCGKCHEYFVNEDGTDRACACDRAEGSQ